MTYKIRRFLPFITAIIVFSAAAFFLINTLPGIHAVEIDMQIDQPDQLRVFYSQSDKFHEGAASESVPISVQRSKVKVPLTGSFAGYLRIDTGEQVATTKIFAIKLISNFRTPRLLAPEEIGQLFVAGPHAELHVHADHVQVVATGNDPYLIGIKRLFPPMYWQSCLVSLALAILVWICMQRPIGSGLDTDYSEKQHFFTAQDRFNALDGLRGLAAMMVIADHTCGWFRGLGASGVWIFFALSGFLLARPFVTNPQAVLSFSYISRYFRRRFMRILPMYYAYIFAVYVLSGRISMAVMHGLFLEGAGHLWAIPQEILFYLLWPCVVFILVLPLRKHQLVTLIALFLVMLLWNRFIGREQIWLLGMDFVRLPLFFGAFMSGAFFSFLYSYISPAAIHASRPYHLASCLASPVGFAIIFFFIMFSTGNILGNKVVYSQNYFGYFGFFAGLLIFAALLADGRSLDRFLSLGPFRELGRVGLSLYLVHPLVKNVIEEVSIIYFGYKIRNLALFVITLGCSYILARYTFTHIEQPAFQDKTAKLLPNKLQEAR